MTNFLGVDCGQASDPAAWALIERRVFAGKILAGGIVMDRDDVGLVVAHAELHATAYSRWPLRTPYTSMVRKIGAIAMTPDFYGDLVIVVDCTRERAVYDIMMESPDLHGTTIIPMVITSGNHVTADKFGWYNVPEAELLAALTVSLEGAKLVIERGGGQEPGPKGYAKDDPRGLSPDTVELVRQLENIKRRVSARRNRVGMSVDGSDVEHDDMAFALAFAVWYAKYTGALEGPQVEQRAPVKPFDIARWGLTD